MHQPRPASSTMAVLAGRTRRMRSYVDDCGAVAWEMSPAPRTFTVGGSLVALEAGLAWLADGVAALYYSRYPARQCLGWMPVVAVLEY